METSLFLGKLHAQWEYQSRELGNNKLKLTRSKSLPTSSISGTNFSIGCAGLEVKAFLGRATSLGQSSSSGSPITL